MPGRLICSLAVLLVLTGCRAENHFLAEDLPRNSPLRLTSQANPQTVNLSRLASATGSSELIGSGDVLEVVIAAGLSEKDQIRIPVRVGNDGTVNLPEFGPIPLAGLAPEAAESMIALEAVRRNLYPNPAVTVTIRHARMNRVRVLGAVRQEGTYQLPPNSSDIVSAIAAAGGLAENAGQNVEVRNPAVVGDPRPAVARDGSGTYAPVSSVRSEGGGARPMNSYTIDLISAARDGDGSYIIHDGGVVMVEKRDPSPIQVLGLVRKPDRYDYPLGKDLYLLDAIAMAGGVSNQLADKVFVIRPLATSHDPAVIEISLKTAKMSGDSNMLLGPGDVVSVEQTPATVFLEALQIIRFGVSSSIGTFF